MLKTSAGITLTRATSYFDLIIVGHHPPEIDAAPFLQDLSYKGTCPRVLILREDEDLDFSPTLSGTSGLSSSWTSRILGAPGTLFFRISGAPPRGLPEGTGRRPGAA